MNKKKFRVYVMLLSLVLLFVHSFSVPQNVAEAAMEPGTLVGQVSIGASDINWVNEPDFKTLDVSYEGMVGEDAKPNNSYVKFYVPPSMDYSTTKLVLNVNTDHTMPLTNFKLRVSVGNNDPDSWFQNPSFSSVPGYDANNFVEIPVDSQPSGDISINVGSLITPEAIGNDDLITFVLYMFKGSVDDLQTDEYLSFNIGTIGSANSAVKLTGLTQALSSNNNLSNLTVSSGTLQPAFSSGTTTYSLNVPAETSQLSITPTIEDSNSTMTVNGVSKTSNENVPVALNEGSNTITIVVTAQNGSTKTYTVTVNRAVASAAAPDVESTDTLEDHDTAPILIGAGSLNTTHFKIENLLGGTLKDSNGQSVVSDGFITKAQGNSGLIFTPSADAYGTSGFGFDVRAARDVSGTGLSLASSVAITVTEVNDPPVAVNDILTDSDKNKPVVIPVADLIANDSTGPGNESGQTLTLTDAVLNNGEGTVGYTSDDITFTPDDDFTGAVEIQYEITDNGTTNGTADAKSSTATIQFAVLDTAGLPVVTDAITDEDTMSDAGLVVTRDTTSTTVTNYFKITSITNGKLYKHDGVTEISNNDFISVAEGNAGLKFIPNENLNSTTQSEFGFTILGAPGDENRLLSDEVEAVVTVNAVNDAPLVVQNAQDEVNLIAGNSSDAIKLADLFDDLDGDNLTFDVTQDQNEVSSFLVENGDLTITGTAEGTRVLTIEADDSNGGTVAHMITVNVSNQAPALSGENDLAVTVKENGEVSRVISANDPDGHTVVISVSNQAANGTATVEYNEWTYVPDPGFTGNDQFKLTLSDGYGGVSEITIEVTVIPLEDYQVYFDLAGYTIDPVTVEEGSKASRPTDLFTRTGYSFTDWYTSNEYTTMYDFDQIISANVTLYGKWEINSYTLTFEPDNDSVIPSQTVNYDQVFTEPTAPVKTGHTFESWYTDAALSNEYNFIEKAVADLTLYAKWNKDSFTVSFDSKGGSAVSDTTVLYENLVTRPANPIRSGYQFGGWYTNDTLTSQYAFTTPVTQNLTLYAKWNQNSTPGPGPSPNPEPTPDPNVEEIVVDVTDGSTGGTLVQTPIKRSTNTDGTKSDNILLTPEKVKEFAEASTNKLARIVIPDANDEVKETNISIPKDALDNLRQDDISVQIDMNDVVIDIPVSSLTGFTDDLYFRVVPVKEQNGKNEIEERAKQEEKVKETAGAGAIIKVLGRPMTIETNLQSRPVTLTLPLPQGISNGQMQSLAVFIEHSDGTKEVIKGTVIELSNGQKAVQFEVTKFSTFTILTMEMADVPDEGEEPEKPAPNPYIKGFENGTFRPGAAITRQQMAAMLARQLAQNNVPTANASPFSDLKRAWAINEIEYVREAGIMTGHTTSEFRPHHSITRAQMAAIAMRWIDQKCSEGNTYSLCEASTETYQFSDVPEGHWAYDMIDRISQLGIMTGYENGTFQPNATLTRAQAVKVLNRIFERYPEEGKESKFSDVPEWHWAFDEIMEAAN